MPVGRVSHDTRIDLQQLVLEASDNVWELFCEILFLFGDEEAGPYFIDTFQGLRQEGIESRTMDLMLARTFTALERYADAEPVLLEALERYGADPDVHLQLHPKLDCGFVRM